MKRITAAALSIAILLMGGVTAFGAEQEIQLNKAAVYENTELDGGKLAPVMLLSYEGEDYYLAPSGETKKLEKLVEHTVNVKGTVKQDAKKRNVITVKSFEESFN